MAAECFRTKDVKLVDVGWPRFARDSERFRWFQEFHDDSVYANLLNSFSYPLSEQPNFEDYLGFFEMMIQTSELDCSKFHLDEIALFNSGSRRFIRREYLRTIGDDKILSLAKSALHNSSNSIVFRYSEPSACNKCWTDRAMVSFAQVNLSLTPVSAIVPFALRNLFDIQTEKEEYYACRGVHSLRASC